MQIRHVFPRLALAALVLGALGLSQAPSASAQSAEIGWLALRYDLDRPDANPFFCTLEGSSGIADPWKNVVGRVITSGSSTTVTEQTAGELPFRDLVVGDLLRVDRVLGTGTVVDIVAITAKASGASITVDTAVDWQNGTAGMNAKFKHPVCGQAVTDGWFNVAKYADWTVVVTYSQGDFGAGLDWRVECRDAGSQAQPVQVFPVSLGTFQTIATASTTAVTASNALAGFERWQDCRVALLANTSDPSDAGAALDRIRVTVIGTLKGGN